MAVTATLEEFTEMLKYTAPDDWEMIQDIGEYGFRTDEIQNRIPVLTNDELEVELVVYSSIDRETGVSRDYAEDAMRVVLLDVSGDEDRFISKTSDTVRTKGWQNRMQRKIAYVWHNPDNYVKSCEECGSLMTKRDAGNGPFFGCTSYPDCEYTEKYIGL